MREKRSSSPGFIPAVVLLVLVLLPLVYVLSVGPVACVLVNLQIEQHHWAMQAAETFYFPLISLVAENETLAPYYEWYLSFWVPVDL